MIHRLRHLFSVLTFLAFATSLSAQTATEIPAFTGASGLNKPRPYFEVLKGAKTSDGVFKVHRVDEKVFYEIPRGELEKQFLMVTQVAKTQAGYGYGGTELGNRIVRWQQRGLKIFLRNIDYSLRSTDSAAIQAVGNSNVDAILAAFDIKTFGKDSTIVIDATDFFTSDVPEFSPRAQLSYDATSIDPKRSFIDKVKSFPANIETDVLLTYRSNPVDPSRPSPQPVRQRTDNSLASITVQVHFSMVRLPDVPMKPREFDARIGFFTQNFIDYGAQTDGVGRKQYISRFRLEKKEPNASLSEPVKPIVFYLAADIPTKWRPYMKRGVEAWQRAFEKAGFKNAILCKDAPEGDPDWDPEDARYASIRWLPSEIQNAYGPSIRDPRTGEVLDADIKFYHNVAQLFSNWYFLQAGAVDPRTDKMPLPDSLAGELLQYVTTHEVGHTLGFPHNFKASSSYTAAQLRDPVFTSLYGTEASIMDYGRFNYVAQPGDNAKLIPIVGPYDMFAVEWGYRQFTGLSSAAEKAALDKLALQQVSNPVLRFGRQGDPLDPTAQSEDLGSDPLEITPLGLKNLDLVAKKMVKAYARSDEDYTKLESIAREWFNQRTRECNHVASLIGGVVETNYYFGSGEKNFEPVSRERQKAAMTFLQQTVFTVPAEVIPRDLINRIGATGYADLIQQHQAAAIRTVLGNDKTRNMTDFELTGESRYGLVEMVNDLTDGIFTELRGGVLRVSPVRRNVQRELVGQLVGKTLPQAPRLPGVQTGPALAPVSAEMKAVARGQLSKLLKQLRSKQGADEATRFHLSDLQLTISNALENK
ncbi:MAG: zinc-dependent metalloprotease [Rhizobacter sp.]|nr:zinc-dependent metalloprotease [Chlorobiales bacterium]